MHRLLAAGICTCLFAACQNESSRTATNDDATTLQEQLRQGQVQVVTQGMEFITADTLFSGWNTFTYKNESPEVHFMLLDLYPAGKTIADTRAEVLPPFDDGMRLLMEGDMEGAGAAFGKLPAWFQEVQYMGGTGLISPNQVGSSTVYLTPGRYMMECYVKMNNGAWHTSHGMLKELIVLDSATTLVPPTPTAHIDISSSNGMVLRDSLAAGNQVFEVLFTDQKVYEHFIGHDVNLVRQESNGNLDSLLHWMNWMNSTGLRSPAPGGFTFLGGMNNLAAGGKGYFSAALTPGRYLLIAEVPEADKKNLLTRFTIP